MLDTILYLSALGVGTLLYGSHFSVLTPPLRWLAVAISVTFLGTSYAVYAWRIAHLPNNLFVFHWLTVGQYAAFSLMFSQSFSSRLWQRITAWSVPLFSIVALGFSLTIQPWTHYNSYALTLYNLLLTVWSLQYLRQLFVEIKMVSLAKDAMFWVSTTILYTALGNLFVQGLMNYLMQRSTSSALSVYWIQELLNGIEVMVFIWAWFIYRRQLRANS